MPSGKSIEAGRAFLRLLIDDKEFAKGLSASVVKLDQFGRKLQGVALKLGAAGAALTAPFAAATLKFVQLGTELDDIAARTGATVETLSELKFAAEQSGAGITDVERAFKSMARFIGRAERNVSTATDALRDMGLKLSDLVGLHPDEQFDRLAKAIGGIQDPTKRAELAMKAFGSTALVKALDGLDDMRKTARETGRVMTTEMAAAAAELGDAMAALKSSVEAATIQVGAALAPAMLKAVQALDSALPSIISWIKQNNEMIIVVAAAGVAIQALAIALGTVATAFRGAAAAALLFKKSAILTALPGPLKLAALAGGAGALAAEVSGRLFPEEELSTAQQIEREQRAIADAKKAIISFTGSQNEMDQLALQSARSTLAIHEKILAVLQARRKLEVATPLPAIQPRNPAFEDNRQNPLPVVQPRLPNDWRERFYGQMQRMQNLAGPTFAGALQFQERSIGAGRYQFGGKSIEQNLGAGKDDTARRSLTELKGIHKTLRRSGRGHIRVGNS